MPGLEGSLEMEVEQGEERTRSRRIGRQVRKRKTLKDLSRLHSPPSIRLRKGNQRESLGSPPREDVQVVERMAGCQEREADSYSQKRSAKCWPVTGGISVDGREGLATNATVHATSMRLLAECSGLAIFSSTQMGQGRTAAAGTVFVLLSSRTAGIDHPDSVQACFYQVAPLPSDVNRSRRAIRIATSKSPPLTLAGATSGDNDSLLRGMSPEEVTNLDFDPDTCLAFVSPLG